MEKHLQFDWVIAPSGQLGYLYDEGVETPVALQYNPRDLYDFFDEQGVYVTVEAYPRHGQIIGFCQLLLFEKGSTRPSLAYGTRAEAEVDAFTAGFEKLEEMLNQKEG